MRKKSVIFLLLVMLLFMLSSCSKDEDNDKLNVVVSTTMLADLVKQVGQDKVKVVALFKPGMDPHMSMPTGAHTRAIQKADVIIFSGLHLELHFRQVIDAYPKKSIEVGNLLDQSLLIKNNNEIDPHFWFSVPLWIDALKIVSNTLQEYDHENKDYYLENENKYLLELLDLHEWILTEVDKLKSEKKILITAHDAFAYFGREYGFDVNAVRGLSTEGEADTNSIINIVNLIISKDVKAIFVESTVSKTITNSVIEGVKNKGKQLIIGGELYSDALGFGDDSQYINALKTNVNNIVNALL